MVLRGPPQVTASTDVRRVRPDEVDILYPASVAMYTEELGVSPEAAGGASLYRARVTQMVSRGLAFAHIEGDEVLFKAELGPITPHSSQLQSVWVNPRYRGRGLVATRVAAVCEAAVRDGLGGVALRQHEQRRGSAYV